MDAIDAGSSSLIFVVLGVAVLYAILVKSERSAPNFKHVPTLGYSGYLASYFDALLFIRDGSARIRRGYAQSRPSIFKISTLNRWLVVVTGTQHIEELRKAPEDEVSFVDAANKTDSDTAQYLLGHCRATTSPEAIEFTRHLTQSLTFLIPEMREEVVASLSSLSSSLQPSDDSSGWSNVNAMDIVAQTTTRVVNRVFFGLAFSRDKEYIQLSVASIRHDTYAFRIPFFLNLLPEPLSSFLRLFRASYHRQRRMKKLAATFVREQQKKKNALELRELDHEESKRHDLLSRILEDETNNLSEGDIATILFDLSRTATQIISMTFVHALYHLAASHKHAVPMRKEIESVVSWEGWSGRNALDKMRKLDSFLKESMRVSGISGLSTMRKTLIPLTFLDGTQLPADTLLFSAASGRHHDASLYPSPDIFDGFRFSNLHEQHSNLDGEDTGSVRFQCTTTSPAYLAWGYGRHACPGRFFAVAVMKVMLAQVLLQWDVRSEDGVRPKDVCICEQCLPDGEARMLVRKR